jgi:transcriptional regulator with XRE-family HTH domain
VSAHPNAFAARTTRELAALRKAEKVTVLELAERLDTTVQNVQRIERGQNVTLRTLHRIATALGFKVAIKFERDPRGPRSPPPGRKR